MSLYYLDFHLEKHSFIHSFVTDISHASCLPDPVIIGRTKLPGTASVCFLYSSEAPRATRSHLGCCGTGIREQLAQRSDRCSSPCRNSSSTSRTGDSNSRSCRRQRTRRRHSSHSSSSRRTTRRSHSAHQRGDGRHSRPSRTQNQSRHPDHSTRGSSNLEPSSWKAPDQAC